MPRESVQSSSNTRSNITSLNRRRQVDASGLVACSWCLERKNPKGITRHEKYCLMRPTPTEDSGDIAFNALIDEERRAAEAAIQMTQSTGEIHDNISAIDGHSDAVGSLTDAHADTMIGTSESEFNSDNNMSAIEDDIQMENTQLGIGKDDIMVKFHPNTGRDDAIYSFDEYCNGDTTTSDSTEDSNSEAGDNQSRIDTEPWKPFNTRLDFELAELMLSAHMNRAEIEALLSIINRAAGDPDSLTIRSFSDLSKAWEHAKITRGQGFVKKEITVTYRGEDMTYEVWMRPLWSWCRELLTDPELINEFRWDAEKNFKFNGQGFVRFIDEPWTADGWWEFQSRPTTPPDASPFFIIFYADKTRLSSFGTEKGYPVLVRCANLPVDIRNGTGVGGGRLIGWLPIPEDDSEHSGKREYVNLKRLIWHKSVHEIISSIKDATFLGSALQCGDGKIRNIFPQILMISADYEEQAMIALIRGTNSLYPCPVCLVPKDEIPNLTKKFPLRTTPTMRAIHERAQELTSTEREELLKQHGLRDTANVFWDLQGTDVYEALSFDVLHAYDGGMFKGHLLEILKTLTEELGRSVESSIDNVLREIPPWPGLNHFSSLRSTGEMADGTKFEDLSKVVLFVTAHVLTPQASQQGYILLQLIRSYLELRMFASLTVQTEVSIQRGETECSRFEAILSKYQKIDNTGKAWNFPKAHTHQHMFRDIMKKGATRNYNTKPNEKANGPLKKFYQHHTNFKRVAPQILRVSEMDLVSTIIRTGIDALDDANNQAALAQLDEELTGDPSSCVNEGSGSIQTTSARIAKPVIGNDHVRFGSALPLCTLEEIELKHGINPIFTLFRRRLSQAMTQQLRRTVKLSKDQKITPYQFVKVFYNSVVDWKTESNILRTNPRFYDKSRYDFALIKVEDNNCIFVQLQFMFGIQYEDRTYYMALVIPHDIPCSLRNRPRDNDLRLIRVQPRPRANSVFIQADTIIRGGLLVKDGASDQGEHFVVNFLDQDMWMRLQPEFTQLVTHANI